MKMPISDPVLKTWLGLNNYLRTATQKQCEVLLEKELEGRKRKQVIRRIYSRLNRVRAHKERAVLTAKIV